jgi:hypothetical protein
MPISGASSGRPERARTSHRAGGAGCGWIAAPAPGGDGSRKPPEMGTVTLVAILLATGVLATFDLLAMRFGADSRDPGGDDRRWRIR